LLAEKFIGLWPISNNPFENSKLGYNSRLFCGYSCLNKVCWSIITFTSFLWESNWLAYNLSFLITKGNIFSLFFSFTGLYFRLNFVILASILITYL